MFVDKNGNRKLVKNYIPENKIYNEITRYVKTIYPNFRIYYIRSWMNEQGEIVYDFGSYSEFFVLLLAEQEVCMYNGRNNNS